MKRKLLYIPILINIMTFMMWILSPAVLAEGSTCAADGHNFAVTRTEPTPTSDGEILYTCVICSFHYSQILAATEHHWGEWIIDKSATCTEKGERHHTCTTTNIPHREYEDIPPLGHEYETATSVPTCVKPGEKIMTCKRCGDTVKENIGASSGHKYKDEVTLQPTFFEEGIRAFTCEICGDTYNEPIPLITEHNHVYTALEERRPSCEQAGEIIWQCSVCADRSTEVLPALSHEWCEWIVDKRENLTDEGQKHRVCALNSEHTEHEAIPRGITSEVTPAAVAIGTANAVFVAVSVLTIASNLRLFRWYEDLRKLNALRFSEFGVIK